MKDLNQVRESELVFKGSNYGQQGWDESLIYKRYSWYNGVTLDYEVLISPLNKDSKFYSWLNSGEKKLANRCEKFYTALLLGRFNAGVNKAYIINEFEKNGLKYVSLAGFGSQVKSYYIYNQLNLINHKVMGFCSNKELKSIKISLPGYRTQVIDL
jgi:hypothetical protein